jgi:nitrogen fixation protein NifB
MDLAIRLSNERPALVRPIATHSSEAGPADMPAEIWDKVKNHPCYSEEAHHHYARMHVAVAPACNIQCNYCNRKYDCSNEAAPAWSARSSRPTRR